MGYHTEFNGDFSVDKPLDDATFALLKGLACTRRMKRKGLDPAVYGVDGEFYYKEGSDMGQEHDDNIVDYNTPPSTQPGLWLQWTPLDDRITIEWDGGEKFYNYVEWLEYIVDKILAPRGYKLSGEVYWDGEDSEDKGKITVKNNKIVARQANFSYNAPRKRVKVKLTKLQAVAKLDKRILELKAKKKALLANG